MAPSKWYKNEPISMRCAYYDNTKIVVSFIDGNSIALRRSRDLGMFHERQP